MSNWQLGVNDPDFIGWLTTMAYLLVSGLCWLCGVKVRSGEAATARLRQRIWWLFAAVVLTLGINKQLDLQTPLIATARYLAQSEGWYRERRVVQWLVIGATMVCGGALLGWLAWRVRCVWQEFIWVFIGLALLLVFVAIRAAPVTLDAALGTRHPVPGKRHMLELAGIVCVGAAAGLNLRKEKVRKRK